MENIKVPNNTGKIFFGEIAYIRILLILLLVFYHAFIIYNDGWHKLSVYTPNEIYKWLDRFSYSFMLEAFCMISGFLFGYQFFNKSIGGGKFIYSKVKRLLFPSFVFSLVYIMMFIPDSLILCIDLPYKIINGAGHLWFLPMLFWCFVFSYYMLKCGLSVRWCFCITLLLSYFSLLPLPLRLNSTFNYLLFFVLGIMIYQNRDKILNRINWFYVCIFILAYLILFISLTNLTDSISSYANINIKYKLFCWFVLQTSRLIYSMLGCICIYMVMILIFKKRNYISKYLLKLSNLCFGVYIYQQFILMLLYYHTEIPEIVGNLALPWVGFVVTLGISIFLSDITNRIKLGRYLIG